MIRELFRAARREPAFALYLAALATLGVKWLSPLSSLNERAIWSDLLLAAAAMAWLLEGSLRRRRPRIRAFHAALGLFLAAALLSAAFAGDRETAGRTILLVLELCVLALLTSEFASDRARLNAIVLVVCMVSLYTAALAIVGLGLFYAGVDTSLLGSYGGLNRSERYARVTAGFESAPLLGSFCIFASAVVAREDVTVPVGLRRATQVALAALVLLTLSRAVIGFAAALAIRAGYRHRASRRVRVAAIAFVVFCIGVIGALTLGYLFLDPTRPASVTYEAPDPHNRREAFATSVDTLEAHPFVGEGPGSKPGENRGEPFRAHMTPLNIAATMGPLALGAMILLIVTLWRNRRRPTPIATWSGLAGLGIDGLSQDIDHFRHLWVLIGLADADRDREDELGKPGPLAAR